MTTRAGARRGRVAVLAVLGAVSVLLAGCGGPTPTPTPAPGAAQAYLDLVLGVAREQMVQRTTAAEEHIAACMAAEGFEYLPDLGAYALPGEPIEPPRASLAFAEQFGYGWVRAPAGMTSSSEGRPEDPNGAILAAMSEAEADRYSVALLGPAGGAQGDEAGGDQGGEPGAGGCMAAAFAEVFRGPIQDPVGAALVAEVERIAEQGAPADARITVLDDRWSACMADAGHPGYPRQPDASAQAQAWYQAGAGERGFEVLPDGTVVGEAELLAQEQALATADWRCRAETDYDATVGRVRAEIEQEYVDTHRDELEAWVERWALAGGGGG